MNDKPVKICATCGRDFQWRRKWMRNWDQVRYCSERCRRRRPGDLDRSLERGILELLQRRTGTICPSEAARAVDAARWRELLQQTRNAGRRLAAQNKIVVLQRGTAVDPGSAKGAIRYGRGPVFPDP